MLASGGNRRMISIAVSPDGRWLAVGGWYEAGVRVWDLHRRRLEQVLRSSDAVTQAKFYAGFSPDGRWLISATQPDAAKGAYHFWRVGTWKLERPLEHEGTGIAPLPPAFTRDGRLMALAIEPDQVLLADASTGRELARLTTSQPVNPTPLAFSPDGTKLVASTNQRTALVWDLRLIRDQLAPLGLDWDAPAYSTAPEPHELLGPLSPPRSVRVEGEVIETQARRALELAEMDRRIAVQPDDAGALIHRGWLFSQQKKWPKATADLEHLLRLRPGDTDAAWLLADAYRDLGNLTRAIAAYGRLVEQLPDDRDARLQHGLLALALGEPDRAIKDFSHVLRLEPDLDAARYRRAQASIRLGRRRESLADLEILIAKYPDDPMLYDLRGTAWEALGDRERARADREKADSLWPSDATALNNEAWTFATGPITQRDPDLAVALARRAVALEPGRQLTLNTLGVSLYRAGQHASAVSILEQSLAAGNGDFDGFDLFFLAMAHQKLEHAAKARGCFFRAIGWWSASKNLRAPLRAELTGFRAEAEEVLAVDLAEFPADVFARH